MISILADRPSDKKNQTLMTESERSYLVVKGWIKEIGFFFIYKPTENFSRQLLFEALTVLKESLALHFSNFVSSTRVAAAA